MRRVNLLTNYGRSYHDIVSDAVGERPQRSMRQVIAQYFDLSWFQEFAQADRPIQKQMLRQAIRRPVVWIPMLCLFCGLVLGMMLSGREIPKLPEGVTQQMVDDVQATREFIRRQGTLLGNFQIQESPNRYDVETDLPPEIPGRLQVFYAFERTEAQAVINEIAVRLGWRLDVEEIVVDRIGYRVIVEGFATMQMAEALRQRLNLDEVIRRDDRYHPAGPVTFRKEVAVELAESLKYSEVTIISDLARSVAFSVVTPSLEPEEQEDVIERLQMLGYRPVRI